MTWVHIIYLFFSWRIFASMALFGNGLHPTFLPSILVVCTVQLEALSANDLSAVWCRPASSIWESTSRSDALEPVTGFCSLFLVQTREISGDISSRPTQHSIGQFTTEQSVSKWLFTCSIRTYAAFHIATAVRAGGDKKNRQHISVQLLILSLQHNVKLRYLL